MRVTRPKRRLEEPSSSGALGCRPAGATALPWPIAATRYFTFTFTVTVLTADL